MKWRRLKALVESRFAPSLVGRLELRAARYRHAHDGTGCIWGTLDGVELTRMSYLGELMAASRLQEELRTAGVEREDVRIRAGELLTQQNVISEGEARQALLDALSQTVEAMLASPLPLVRMLAVADRRLGKRRLRALLEHPDPHPLVRAVFTARCIAEEIIQ